MAGVANAIESATTADAPVAEPASLLARVGFVLARAPLFGSESGLRLDPLGPAADFALVRFRPVRAGVLTANQ